MSVYGAQRSEQASIQGQNNFSSFLRKFYKKGQADAANRKQTSSDAPLQLVPKTMVKNHSDFTRPRNIAPINC